MLTCEKCNQKVDYPLLPMLYQDGEKLLLCRDCWDYEDMRADAEYERQREEYDPDNPDHERDIKETYDGE